MPGTCCAFVNGLAPWKLRPFAAGFFIVTAYARGAIRLSALMELPVVYLWTHDSISLFDLFEQQDQAYRDHVLPNHLRARVAVEEAGTYGWERYVGLDGVILGMRTFGGNAHNASGTAQPPPVRAAGLASSDPGGRAVVHGDAGGVVRPRPRPRTRSGGGGPARGR